MKKRMMSLLLIICLLMTYMIVVPDSYALAAGGEVDFWAVSYTTYDVTYEAILKMYLKVINGYQTKNYGRHDLFNEFLFWDYEDTADLRKLISSVKSNIGYYIDDINQDGIEELVINSTGGYIYEVFTMDNGRVRELIRAGGRYTCQRLNNGLFLRCGSGGAMRHNHELWRMNGTGKVSIVEAYYARPDEQALYEVCYRSTADVRKTESVNGQRVSSTAAKNWIAQQEKKVVRKRFVPFSAYEKYQDDPWDLGVLAKDNKTSTTVKIRIRKEPKANAKVIETKKVGTYVKILAKENGYYKIQIGNKIGYVQEEYLIPVTWGEEPEAVG